MNYNFYSAKARTVEAKNFLAAIYALEKSYYGEYQTYTSCINQLGITRDGQRTFYNLGNATATTLATCGISGTQLCRGYAWASNGTPSALCITTDALLFASQGIPNSHAWCTTGVPATLHGTDVTTNTFVMAAEGCISSRTKYDGWSIDENKVLRHVYVGF